MAEAPDVKAIGIDDLDRLGVGPDRMLYWDGKPVEIRKTVHLSRLQTIGAFAVGAFAILGGIGAFATGLKDGSEYACDRHWIPEWTCASEVTGDITRRGAPGAVMTKEQ